MKQIWKYQLTVRDRMHVLMPRGAKILTVQIQRDNPCVWALVDPEKADERRTFVIFGTGHPVIHDERLIYIGSFQLDGGALIFHVFEEITLDESIPA